MRWPFRPPHLTLKPSKKNKKKKNNQKTQKYQKMSFSAISQIFLLFLVGVQKIPFLKTWPKPKKHNRNRGFSKSFFEKQICVTKRPFLDKRIPNPEISVIIFFAFFFSFNNKKHKHLLKPYFYSVLANLKREFQNFNLKHRKSTKKQFLHPFCKKAFFRKLPDNWATKKTHNDN